MKISEQDIPLTAEDMDEVETILGFKIPQAARELYLESNGGRIAPSVFENERAETLVAEFIPLKSAKRETVVEVYQYFAQELTLVPRSFLPFANDAGGDYFFLDTSVPNGSVYLLRHDNIRPDPLINLELEFNEFWASLKDRSELPIDTTPPSVKIQSLPGLIDIESAQKIVYSAMPPTPQYSWPLLNQRLGTQAFIKHENHSPVGAFKLRGALVYATMLKEAFPELTTLVAATRGNHGQGVGMAARLLGLRAIIVVPHGNSKEKNLAMQAQGVELIEHGQDFQASLEYARELAAHPGHAMIESFHPHLVAGTATYALEFFRATPPLKTIYVPIGLGSSICGVSAVRNALGLKTEIVGVVASSSPSYALSFRERRIVEAPAQTQIADGLACRLPNAGAMQVIWDNVARIVEVSDAEIASAMRAYYHDTHNIAEGAAAAALAGALQEKSRREGQPIGIVLTGGNIDRDLYTQVLNEKV